MRYDELVRVIITVDGNRWDRDEWLQMGGSETEWEDRAALVLDAEKLEADLKAFAA